MPQETLWDAVDLSGPGQVRRTDPDTSHQAARLIRARASTARVLLLEAFAAVGSRGLTDEEAARHAGLPLTSEYATRCSELDRLGAIATTSEHRRGASGMERVVRVVTPFGGWILDQRATREAR